MGSHTCPYTDQLVMYMVGECTAEEHKFLSKHIDDCPACRQEWNQLRHTWQSIPLGLDEVEPPADLKAEVMTAIFADSPAPQPEKKQRQIWRRSLRQLLRPSQSWVTAALLIALCISLWDNWSLRTELLADHAPAMPAQLMQEFTLKPADAAPAMAKGSAWLLQQGEQKRLVFHLQGLAATQGTQAYQIWLIHDGQRTSAGVFQVDPSGSGVVTYELTEQSPPFQAIGITLEPDAGGMKPRGKKVLGT